MAEPGPLTLETPVGNSLELLLRCVNVSARELDVTGVMWGLDLLLSMPRVGWFCNASMCNKY